MEQTAFVEKLVERMKQEEDMKKAFCLAAITGNVKIAKILLLKNASLLWIRDQNDMLPIQLASSAGHIRMTEFLFEKTSEDKEKELSFPDIQKLFIFTINNNIYSKFMHISFAYLTVVCYDSIFFLHVCSSLNSGHMTAVTSKLLERESKLITVQNEERLPALEMLPPCEFSQSLNTSFFSV